MTWLLDKSPTLYERLKENQIRLKTEADRCVTAAARNKLLEKLRQLNVAANIDEWLSSPGLRAPT